jgi:hypothetical protein
MIPQPRSCARLACAWLTTLGLVACTERVPTAPTSSTSPSVAPGCTYELSSTARSHTSAAETAAVVVTAPAGCAWTARTETSWISVISGANGTGGGNVTWMVDANSGPARTGTLTVAGRTVTLNQGAPSPSPYDGRWTGGGTGVSSGSTQATIEFAFQVTDGIIGTSSLSWRVNTAPGSPQLFCSSATNPGFLRIIVGAFLTSYRSAGAPYSYAIRGTFTSTSAVTGTVEIMPVEGAQPWCLPATVNWSATRQ